MVVYRLLSLSRAGWLECGDVKRPKAKPHCQSLSFLSVVLKAHSLQRADKLGACDTEVWTLTCQTWPLSPQFDRGFRQPSCLAGLCALSRIELVSLF